MRSPRHELVAGLSNENFPVAMMGKEPVILPWSFLPRPPDVRGPLSQILLELQSERHLVELIAVSWNLDGLPVVFLS
jgi:hypothetical protein